LRGTGGRGQRLPDPQGDGPELRLRERQRLGAGGAWWTGRQRHQHQPGRRAALGDRQQDHAVPGRIGDLMATYDVTVNGVSLHTLGYQCDVITGRRGPAGRRNTFLELGGMDGVVGKSGPILPLDFGLELWVHGRDPLTGARPADPALQHELNMDTVLRAFLQPGDHDVRIAHPGGERQALALVTATAATEVKKGLDPITRLSVAYRAMDGAWRSPGTFTRTYSSIGSDPAWTAVDFLQTCSAPIVDAVLTVTGPVTNPRIEAGNGAPIVQYVGVLAEGETWTIDSGTWDSRVGSVSVITSTNYHGSRGRLLTIDQPYQLRCVGSSVGSGAQWTITAHQKWAG